MEKKQLKIVTSWDDGGAGDPILAKILTSYGLRGIFFIPNNKKITDEQLLEIAEHHEIGGHTVSHYQDLKQLPDEVLDYEIQTNREWLQKLTGQEITKFCYPRGRYNDRVVDAVKRAGYSYARTTLIGHTDCADPFRTHTSVHVFQRPEYGDQQWYDYAVIMAISAEKSNTTFHLWGHSDEVEKNKNVDLLIGLFDLLSKNYQFIQ